jgi:hypothetical protein
MQDIGTGMLIAAAGTLAADLGFSNAVVEEGSERLSFGRLTPLVRAMQQTPADKLQPLLVDKLKRSDVSLSDLIGAAALANAQTLGGEDYVGYHCEMALTPALAMASELPAERQALPVLKVIYRNTTRLQQVGDREVLKPLAPATTTGGESRENPPTGEQLRETVRKCDLKEAEQLFARICERPIDEAYNELQPTVQDLPMVHRVVLAHRSWQLAKLLGRDHAHTLLRQSLRYCAREEEGIKKEHGHPYLDIRELVPKALDQHRLLSRGPGKRKPDDKWVEHLATTICGSKSQQAVDITAAALAEGMEIDAVAEALVLAANRVILCQDTDGERGRFAHGNSEGIHSSDAINAWRHISRVCAHANGVVSLLVGSYFVAHGSSFAHSPYPRDEHLAQLKGKDAPTLLDELDEAIRNNDQGRATAAAQRYADGGHSWRAIFDRLLRFTISEDGRLHGEKYFHTAAEEFARARPAFRWRHVVSLARVTASAYGLDYKDKPGHRAPGYEDACRLLGVKS